LRICDIYDWHGKGELDMYYFMDIFYALGMNLTKKTTVKYGQTDDTEKAYKKFDEVVALVQQAVKEPEHTGNYFDYVELCKLYDKNENGTMMLAELETFLSLMGKFFFGPTNLTQKFNYQVFIEMKLFFQAISLDSRKTKKLKTKMLSFL
jgi:Ca2+-binding EF-hand superfamily protein